jgi:hypothetical protein
VKVLEANGDGIPDLLTCTGVFRGNGRGEFEPLTNTSLWADYREPGIADFNRDGISDLLFFPEVYSGDGRGGFVLSTTIPFTDGTWLAPLIVDVNNDDKLDLVIANGTHRFAVFLNRSGL